MGGCGGDAAFWVVLFLLPCAARVPRLPVDEGSWQSFLGESISVRQIRVVLGADAVLSRAAGRHEHSARCGMEMIRFGHKVCRGGVVINALGSITAISSGEDILREECRNLDVQTLRSYCLELLELDAKREEYDEILARDRKVDRVAYSSLADTLDRLRDLVDFETKRQIRFHFEWMRTRSRLLIVKLALEAHRKETGAHPSELAELLPSSLSDLRTRIKFEARGFVLRRFDFGRDRLDPSESLL